MYKYLYCFACILLFAAEAFSAPHLLEVEIGKEFPEPFERGWDTGRPTTQFRVPNIGEGDKLFPEYQVAILNDSKKVAIITAERVFASIPECTETKNFVEEWISALYPEHKLSEHGTYTSESSNVHYVISCRGEYGPYFKLHLQFRGKNEDQLLKEAWGRQFQ